jgi:hypothetical protein
MDAIDRFSKRLARAHAGLESRTNRRRVLGWVTKIAAGSTGAAMLGQLRSEVTQAHCDAQLTGNPT